jgi:hypothetical protein
MVRCSVEDGPPAAMAAPDSALFLDGIERLYRVCR